MVDTTRDTTAEAGSVPSADEPFQLIASEDIEPTPAQEQAAPEARPASAEPPAPTATPMPTESPTKSAAEIEAEAQRRERSLRGNLMQEQKRRELAEQQAQEAERRWRDQEAEYDRRLQAARDSAEDPETRVLYQRELEQRGLQREVAQREAAAAQQAQYAQQIIAQAQQREAEQAAAMMRQQTIPTLSDFAQQYGKQQNLTDEDIAALKSTVDSEQTRALFASVEPQVLPFVLRGFGEAIERMVPLMQQRAAQQAQRAAATSGAFRQEGGGASGANEPDVSKYRNSGDVLGLLEALYPNERSQ